jgi:hypothetical protein
MAPVLPILGVAAWHGLPSSALAQMCASAGDARFKARGDLVVAKLAKVQQAAPSKGYHEGFLSSLPKGSRSCDSEQSSRG